MNPKNVTVARISQDWRQSNEFDWGYSIRGCRIGSLRNRLIARDDTVAAAVTLMQRIVLPALDLDEEMAATVEVFDS